MKVLRIIIIAIVVGLILYLPVQMLMQPAKAADEAGKQTDILPLPEELTDFDSGLSPTPFTPDTYRPPQFDPFNNQYRPYHGFEEQISPAERAGNSAPLANFTVRIREQHIADPYSGTTATSFIFDSHSSTDEETKSNKLQVRWDFESDGKPDTYFSLTKSSKHTFEKPGMYNVTLEVMDGGGIISRVTKQVTVVENTAPFAHFSFTPVTGTTNKIFTFNTKKSDDSQYKASFLKYRFDWDGDGIWDTKLQQKTVWRHRFETSGAHHVIMEAQDPEGAAAKTEAYITVTDNIPPVASFTVEVKPIKMSQDVTRNRYYFDASSSSDTENSKKLSYRWDFNYTGENDISFDTVYSTSPRYSGMYDFSGEKTVRLQVRDEDGAVTDSFQIITVE